MNTSITINNSDKYSKYIESLQKIRQIAFINVANIVIKLRIVVLIITDVNFRFSTFMLFLNAVFNLLIYNIDTDKHNKWYSYFICVDGHEIEMKLLSTNRYCADGYYDLDYLYFEC